LEVRRWPAESKQSEHARNDADLTDLDADIESQKRYGDGVPRQANIGERAREAEAMQ